MFLKPTRSGGHTYLQLVESFRNEAGQPRQRTVATLGRLDEVGGGVDSLLAGLLRHKGLPASAASPPQLEFDAALSFVWAPVRRCWVLAGFKMLRASRRHWCDAGVGEARGVQASGLVGVSLTAVALALDHNGLDVVQQPVQQG